MPEGGGRHVRKFRANPGFPLPRFQPLIGPNPGISLVLVGGRAGRVPRDRWRGVTLWARSG